MGLQSCGMLEQQNSLSEVIDNNQAAKEAATIIDSYYLTPCKKPQIATTSDEELMQALNLIDQLMLDYSECYKRHNSLIEQVK